VTLPPLREDDRVDLVAGEPVERLHAFLGGDAVGLAERRAHLLLAHADVDLAGRHRRARFVGRAPGDRRPGRGVGVGDDLAADHRDHRGLLVDAVEEALGAVRGEHEIGLAGGGDHLRHRRADAHVAVAQRSDGARQATGGERETEQERRESFSTPTIQARASTPVKREVCAADVTSHARRRATLPRAHSSAA
jgi:hypothetical protein